MIRKFLTPSVLTCGLVVLLLGLFTLGPYMHETDQGTLLDGGIAISRGQWKVVRGEFDFDKQFVSYLLPGAMFHFFPSRPDPDTVVLAGNVLGLFLFWGAFLLLLTRSRRGLAFALVLPVILTPAFLLHSPFYASAFTSAAFILLLAVFLNRKKWTGTAHAVVFALAFCAVGARADALLLLPLLAMLHSPRHTMLSVIQSPNTWLMATAGLAAFFLGRAFYTGAHFDFDPEPLRWKQILVCLVFGLGGAGGVLLAAFHAVWGVRRATIDRVWLAFTATGLALPIGYYCLQMLSPRHCVVGALSAFVFITAPCGRAIFKIYFRRKRLATVVKFTLGFAALAPVLVGVNLADLRHPRLTVLHPTLLPSHAGVFPVGAYLGHALNFRRLHGLVDHNQALWLAAKATRFIPDANGGIPFVTTPVDYYLILSMHLQGWTPAPFHLAESPMPPRFYVDGRTLMRFTYAWAPRRISTAAFFGGVVLTPATATDWQGITIFSVSATPPPDTDSMSGLLWVLNAVFGGEEFRLEPRTSLAGIPDDWAGKKLVLASRGPFFLAGKRAEECESPRLGHWYYGVISPLHKGDLVRLESDPAAEVYVATSVFPAWLSLQKL